MLFKNSLLVVELQLCCTLSIIIINLTQRVSKLQLASCSDAEGVLKIEQILACYCEII